MLHYTINTAHTFDCSKKRYAPEALNLLRPIAQEAIRDLQTQQSLPEPYIRYSVKTTVVPGCALFDIYDQDTILNSNAVAWSHPEQVECWELFEAMYLRMSGDFETVGISRAPRMPESLPWLATLILPVPAATVSWLADFEQCFALALIKASQSRLNPPRGFGK